MRELFLRFFWVNYLFLIESTISFNTIYGAVHKRRHQSRGEGGCQKIILLIISIFSKNDDVGGGEGQKSQKIDDVFYERPLRIIIRS